MQASEIISQVRTSLVEPVAGFWTDNELLGWLNRAEADFVNRTRLLDNKDYTSSQEGVNEYPLPSNCLSIRGVMYNQSTTTTPDWIRLTPKTLEKNMQEVPNFTSVTSDSQTTPRSYMVWGRTLYLHPTPDVTGSSNIMMFFKAKPIRLQSVTDQLNLDDSLQEGVIAYILWKAYDKENEDEKAEIQRQIYELYIRQGLRWVKKQAGDMRNQLDISSNWPFEGPFDNRFNPLA